LDAQNAFGTALRQLAVSIEDVSSMNRALAVDVLAAIKAAETHLDALSALSEKIENDDERRKFRRGVADIMIGYIDLMRDIVRQYPDLDPDCDAKAVNEGPTG
jgi:hypothetical protein